ncbi:MAG: hypothetical protein ACOH5I_11290 [Oligoflexus sp.]
MKLSHLSFGIGFHLAVGLVVGSYASVGLGQNDEIKKPSEQIKQLVNDQDEVEAAEEAVEDTRKKVKRKRERSKSKRDELKEVGNIDYKKAPPEDDKANQGVMGMGKTLPEKVLRVRLPIINTFGNEGFDDKGERKEMGFDINVQTTALVTEYGLTDKISLQFVAPYVFSNKLGLNANNLRNNNFLFRRERDRYIGAVAKILAGRDQCPSLEECIEFVEKGNYTLPIEEPIVLTTGEVVTAQSGETAAYQIDQLLMKPITPLDGKTGIGDLQIGGLYNFLDNGTISLSAGLGIRLPTGAFKEVPRGQRAIGGGVTDLGARLNFDYQPVRPLVFSLQYQAEQMIAAGKKHKASGISNDKMNTADPTTAAAIAVGSDGKGNEQKFERYGLGHSYVVRVGYGLAALSGMSDFLRPLGVGASYNWFQGRETRYDGAAYDGSGLVFEPIPTASSYTVGASWDGLAFRPLIPLTISIDHTRFLDGENMVVAPNTTTIQFMGYYKF